MRRAAGVPEDYPYVWAWAYLHGYQSYHIEDFLRDARKSGAPAGSTHRDYKTGEWTSWKSASEVMQSQMEEIIREGG